MREIKRDIYLQRLINKRENGLIKVVTGIRRWGKSYLLDPIFTNYLRSTGVKQDHIIKLELDRIKNKKYLDPEALDENGIIFMGIYDFLLDENSLNY